jgi:hypothetical protein
MGELAEIKKRLEALTPDEQAEIRSWFLERDERMWDDQIARDLAAGKLDDLINEALADRKAGKARDL